MKPHDDSNQSNTQLEALRQEVVRLRASIEEKTAENELLSKLAETDLLTDVGNRRSFEKELQRRHHEQIREGHQFCLMLADVDDFKRFNDLFGHQVGDIVLRAVAELMVAYVRASDIVFRIGGDEFAILLPGATLERAKVVARRLLEKTCELDSKFESKREVQNSGPGLPKIRLSIGIVESQPDLNVQDIFREADMAMYQAKNEGGNRYSASSRPKHPDG